MLDATHLNGWGGVGVRGAWTQLKEETDAAALTIYMILRMLVMMLKMMML